MSSSRNRRNRRHRESNSNFSSLKYSRQYSKFSSFALYLYDGLFCAREAMLVRVSFTSPPVDETVSSLV